jgi:hypothetical protein
VRSERTTDSATAAPAYGNERLCRTGGNRERDEAFPMLRISHDVQRFFIGGFVKSSGATKTKNKKRIQCRLRKKKRKIIVKLIIESKKRDERTRPDNRNLKKTGANHPRCNLDIEFVNVSPFFLFRLSQSAAARLSSQFTPLPQPPYYHRTTTQMMTFRSRILRPGKRRNCLGRDVRRLETSDKMNGSTFILLPEKKKKTTTTFLKEMRLSITCFFFFSFMSISMAT